VVCAYEAGLMINPNGVRSQVEGNIMQAVSRTLYEETTFDQAKVTSVVWRSYRSSPPRCAGSRDRSDGQPADKPMERRGGLAPVPAAIGNAVFDAVGCACRRVPLTPRVSALRSPPAAKRDLHELSVPSVAPSGVAGLSSGRRRSFPIDCALRAGGKCSLTG